MKNPIPKLASFALPLFLAGCGGSDGAKAPPLPAPPAPGVTVLRALSISHGEMVPAFSGAVGNYGVARPFIADPGAFAVTASAVDPLARLTLSVHGRADCPMEQGRPAPVQLNEGYTHIRVIAEAQDGGTSVTSIRVDLLRPNTKVEVLGSIGGAHVEGAAVTVRDAMGGVVQADIPVPPEKNGGPLLALAEGFKYSIYAKGDNTAQACFEGFDRTREDKATLYCLPGGGSDAYPASAPTITEIAFATSNSSGSAWNALPLDSNYVVNSQENLAGMKITAKSRNPIHQLAQPVRVKINIDNVAWWGYNYISSFNSGGVSGTAVEEAVLTPDGHYSSTYRFHVPWGVVREQRHWMSIVAYDMADNRTERRLYFDLTSQPITNATDHDLTDIKPYLFLGYSDTYGVARYAPAVTPAPGYGAYCESTMLFSPHPKAELYSWWQTNFATEITGAEIYRSTDDRNFEKINTLNYGYYFEGGGLYYANDERPADPLIRTGCIYVDNTPGLQENVTYYYRVRVFNRRETGGHSLMSDSFALKPLPAFVTQLAAPGHGSVSGRLWPTFSFRVTDPQLLDVGLSSEFNFDVFVKPAESSDPVIDLHASVIFESLNGAGQYEPALDEEGNPLVMFFDGRSGSWRRAVYDTGRKDGEGAPIYAPFVWVQDDGAIAVGTDNPEVQNGAALSEMLPGSVYKWSVFGHEGGIINKTMEDTPGNAAHFRKRYATGRDAARGFIYRDAFSFGSGSDYGLGSPNGWFTLITADDAR